MLPVEYIEINDVKYPIFVNLYVIGLFQKETGLSFADLDDLENNLYLVEPLLFHSIKVGQIVSKVPVTITREDIPILLSDNKTYEDFSKVIKKYFSEQTKELNSVKKK